MSNALYNIETSRANMILIALTTFQFGVMTGLALSPIIIHQANTVAVCGNETYTPLPTPAQFAHWSRNIHDRIFYYLLGQAVVSLIILFFTIAGKLYPIL